MKRKINYLSKFPDLFESLYKFTEINCVVLIDPRGFILQVNRAFTTAFGYTEEDIIGKHARVLCTPEDQKIQRAEVEIRQVLENGNAQDQNYLLHKKGSPIWVNALTEATKAVGGQLKIDKSDFSFQQIMDEAIESVHSLYPGYQIIQLEKADVNIHADRHRIMQVLNNYLTNAIKYSQNSKEIEIRVSTNKDILQVSVKDYGTGIPANQVTHVFNRYYRGESTRKIEGLGLGLYLSKEIILAHKGRVWVESEEGKGSTFYFSIPLQ